MLSEKKLLKEELEARFNTFLYSNLNQYRAAKASDVPGRLFSYDSTLFTKEQYPIGQGSVDLIKENDEFRFLMWHTTPQNLKAAIKSGIVKFDALTSKCLYALGGYQRIMRERVYLQGIVSNKHAAKQCLLNHVQINIEAIEPLERFLNQGQYQNHFQQQKQNLLHALSEYKKTLFNQFATLQTNAVLFSLFDTKIQLKWQAQFEQLMKHYKRCRHRIQLMNNADEFTSYLQPQTPNGLFVFIKQHINWHIRHVQEINQNLAFNKHAPALRKGDFNHACEDAIKEIKDHIIDFHNPILAEHQGNFVSDNNKISVNLAPFCQTEKELKQILMALCQIENADVLIKEPNALYTLTKQHQKKVWLQTTAYTQWTTNAEKYHVLVKCFLFLWNTFIGLVCGLTIDLFLGIAFGLMGIKTVAYGKHLQIDLSNTFAKDSHYQQLSKMVINDKPPLLNHLCIKLHTFIKTIVMDFFHSEIISSTTSDSAFLENLTLVADYAEGYWLKNTDLFNQVMFQLDKLQQEKRLIQTSINNHAPSYYQNWQQPQYLLEKAIPPYELSEGEWLDVCNALTKGMMMGTNMFAHEIYTKNPMLGLVFFSSYGLALMATLHPQQMAILPKAYMHFCHILSRSLAKHKTAGAFSSASLQAQSVMALVENAVDGHNGWISNAMSHLEKNSTDIALAATAATSLGALIAYKFTIPYISENLKNELGKVPYPSLAVAGGKSVFLLTHLLQTQIENLTPASKAKIQTEVLQHPIDTNKFAFLCMIETYQSLLPSLAEIEKRTLLKLTSTLFKEDDIIFDSIHALIYPKTNQSVLAITINSLLQYIPLTLRGMLIPITHSTSAPYELNHAIKKDLTRVYNACSTIVSGAINFFSSLGRATYEVTIHDISARAEGIITEDHKIASSSYQMLKQLDGLSIQTRAYASHHLNQQKQACTQPSTFNLFSKKTELSQTSGKNKLLFP